MHYLTFDICIYHGGCMDGLTAASIVRARNPDILCLPYSYEDAPPARELIEGKRIIIVDFSFKAPVLRAMKEQAAVIVVLDHHKTAKAELQPMIDAGEIMGYFDMDKSGARLAWEWYHNRDIAPAPWLVERVEDRDLWRWAFPDSAEVHAYLSAMMPDDQTEKFVFLDKLRDKTLDGRLGAIAEQAHVIVIGKALLRQRRKDIADLLPKSRHTMTILGVEVPAANLIPQLASEAGNILANDAPDKFAVIWWMDREYVHFSLRSVKTGMDVSAVAKEYGGGGHARAAGFALPKRLFPDLAEVMEP